MTVNTSTASASYIGNGATTVFAVPFYFLVDTDVKISKLTAATGLVSVLTLNSDYTLIGAGNGNGGSATLSAAPATGDQLYIERNVDAVQQTAYPTNSSFPAASHEKALDRLTMLAQQVLSKITFGLFRDPLTKTYDLAGGVLLNSGTAAGDNDVPGLLQVRQIAESIVAGIAGGVGAFIQAGIGAISRTFQDKMREMPVSLRDMGAVMDGTTDDSAAFAKALATGRHIFVGHPGEQVRINSLQTVSASDIVISGGATILHAVSGLLLTGSHITVRGLKFKFVGTGGSNLYAISSTGDHNSVEECEIDGQQKIDGGVQHDLGGTNLTVRRNKFRDCLYMFWGTGGVNNRIEGNFFTGGTLLGVVNSTNTAYTTVPLGDAIKLTSNLAHFADAGYTGTLRNIIRGNVFDGVYRDCADFFTDGSETLFEGNICLNKNEKALDIKTIYRDDPTINGGSIDPSRRTKNVIVRGNIFKNFTHPFDADQAVISITHFKNPESSGVVTDYTLGVHGVLIEGNHFDGILGPVIRGQDVYNVAILNNTGYDLKSVGVYFIAFNKTVNMDVKGNTFVFLNGARSAGTGNVIAVQFTSNLHEGTNVTGNTFVCNRADSVYGDRGIYLTGTHAAANENDVRGFDIGIWNNASDSQVNSNRLKDCQTACIRVATSAPSAIAGVQVIGNKGYNSGRMVNVDTTNVDKVQMTNNLGEGITVAGFTSLTTLANSQDVNNVAW